MKNSFLAAFSTFYPLTSINNPNDLKSSEKLLLNGSPNPYEELTTSENVPGPNEPYCLLCVTCNDANKLWTTLR